MPRWFWKGYLKLSLVTCRVAMLPATSDRDKVRFHTLNAKTGNRVQSEYVDAVTGKTVADEDQAKGYPKSEDEYILLEDEELDAVALESARTIDIDQFVPDGKIGWIWLDQPHYLVPDDKIGAEAFCVIRDAMAATGTVGIARLVLYRRERAVMLQPRDKGIVLWTLRYGDEVRDSDAYFDAIPAGKPPASELKLLTQLIRKQTKDWAPDMAEDPVQDRLLGIIAAKKKGRAKKTPAPKQADTAPDNVVNIIDALKKSIEAEKQKR